MITTGVLTFAELEAHRAAIVGHCYRMLGSAVDAEDAAQEALTRAWRALAGFDGRASPRTWLYRIATNVCLDEVAARKRRRLPMEDGAPSDGAPAVEALEQRPREHWMEPIADERALPPDPAERAILRESIRLAFVTALQALPPKQRAALLLVDVLDHTAQEAADALDTTVPAMNSALQRARAAVAEARAAAPAATGATAPSPAAVDRFVAAFERFDVDGLTAMLREDAVMSMPPYTLWLRGPDAVRTWLTGLGGGCRGSRLLPTAASGLPAFAQYRPAPGGGHAAWALIVLELVDDRIARWTSFLDTAALFPPLGVPMTLPPR